MFKKNNLELNKKNIEDVLSQAVFTGTDEKVLEKNSLLNVQIFGDEIILDFEIQNPTLQYKKKVEQICLGLINKKIDSNLKVKVNFTIKKIQEDNKIKGSPIPGVKNIIAVSSGKGGVGKSTISANLAVALSQLNYKVGLIDADIYGPSMPIMFDLVGEAPKAVEVEGKKKMRPLENYNVKMVSMGFFTELNTAIVWRGPMVHQAIEQLFRDTKWPGGDFMIIDLPPGTGDVQLSLSQLCEITGAVIVSTPQDVALIDAVKAAQMFKKVEIEVLGIVENMSFFACPKCGEETPIFSRHGAENKCSQMDTQFLGAIPIEIDVRKGGDEGKPLMAGNHDSPATIAFNNIADNLVRVLEEG